MSVTPAHQRPRPAAESVDPIWARLRVEAEEAARAEPALAALLYANILNQESLEQAIIHRLAARLDHPDLTRVLIVQAFNDALNADESLGQAFRADIAAVYDRDPACERYLEPVLFFKGFHAVQTHRFTHQLWLDGRHDLAYYLQSRNSSVFGVDIHPAARLGWGLMVDHGTGIVIGETAVVGDNVSMLHAVTLGGSGKECGDRHPKIGSGVLLGAGAKILGNIRVGDGSRVAAGSVVLHQVPACVTVAGIPARVVGKAPCAEPGRAMDHLFADFIDGGADI